MDRHTKLLSTYSNDKKLARKSRALFNARSEVEVNGGGTSGYRIKHGENAGKVLGHRSTKHNNNW